jgi:hypothetical protein
MPRTVPEAKTALLALLSAVTWPGSPQPEIRYGQPTEGEDLPFGGEVIFLGETRSANDVVGPHRRDETFNLRFVIDVRHDGDDEQTTENRAWELAEAAEDAIWADKNVGGTVNRVTRIEMGQVNVPEPQAWRTQIVADLTCTAAYTQ